MAEALTAPVFKTQIPLNEFLTFPDNLTSFFSNIELALSRKPDQGYCHEIIFNSINMRKL